MLTNYFKIAFRTLLKYKSYASINLIGLALGLTAGILILLFVVDELSYDTFHTKADRLYRINTSFYTGESGAGSSNETNGWPIGKIIEKEFPEAEAVLYTRSASSLLINFEGKRIRQKMHYASANFFHLFSFPLLHGNSEKALAEPYSVVISEAMQEKYFPQGDALNKTLVMGDSLSFIVTGVMANIPGNSHIQADMLISFTTFENLNPNFSYNDGWGNINMRNYVLLKEGADINNLATKAKNIYMDRVGEQMKNWGVSAYVEFEPMSKIYLETKSGNGMGPVGSIERVYLLSGIAGFVILLACINFINLATARSVYRAKEVGLRKVVGSTRRGLIAQFLSESFVLTVLSLFLALVFIGLVLPFFNQLLGKSYQLLSLTHVSIISGVIVLVFLVSLLAGYYPALIMSSLRPVEVLKGKMQSSKRGVQLRRSLVIFQFVISVALVAGTLVVIDQLNYMQQQALGFDKDQVLVINAARINVQHPTTFETFKNQLKELASVEDVTYTNALPGSPGWRGQVAFAEGKTGDDAISVEYMAVDENYINTLNLELISGNNFNVQRQAELNDGLILNETAVSLFGWSSPQEAIGKKITSPSRQPEGTVIGVVKDYHQFGLQEKIGPMTMDYAPDNSYLYAVRYKAEDTKALISDVTTLWKSTFSGYDFDYFFLDENFEKQYQAEQRLASVLALFAGITIVIALIGLLGLVSFMVVARTKEIGVRKVLGADILSITRLLSKEFVMLVIVANLIAFPLVWFVATEWLQGFAFRMTLNPLLFVWTMLFALILTIVVVSFQTVKAALTDPVKSLRYE